ncbi:hypothetical protein [Bradyrhizobium genosp. SA-3]|uniref:hypothetical protein n=1 Tax=Bradyrhizobium genosp. SA-3 TaxID=508868 RepID=UPI0013EE481B|nr:hypothetical protein [Bradyrhizobium genosp. SA-3]
MATKKSKPVKFGEKTKDGVIGPKNRQDYSNKGKAKSMPKFSKGGMIKGKC